MQANKRTNENKIHLAVDVVIGLAVLALLSFTLTGLTIHEWLGIGFTTVVIVHLLLNWRWVVATTRRLMAALPGTVRVKYLVDSALFISMTIVIFSGLMISEVALPFVGLRIGGSFAMRPLHSLAANITLGLVGLHLAVNWKWLIAAVKQFILHPFRRPTTSVGTAATTSVRSE